MLLKDSITTLNLLIISLYQVDPYGVRLLILGNNNTLKIEVFKDQFTITEDGISFNDGFGYVKLSELDLKKITDWLHSYVWAKVPMISK
ncbi:MAG: hypothetical protein HRT95_03635 [Moritella sp.]|uniref:hypothetical protein n=1 Tax=Moritella sp. TaxID=78556 RepID=UPI001DF6F208|nr:hypothetical protein [Moritella sp.]NQZ49296.1 hypothetical protein [Moritella sp.]